MCDNPFCLCFYVWVVNCSSAANTQQRPVWVSLLAWDHTELYFIYVHVQKHIFKQHLPHKPMFILIHMDLYLRKHIIYLPSQYGLHIFVAQDALPPFVLNLMDITTKSNYLQKANELNQQFSSTLQFQLIHKRTHAHAHRLTLTSPPQKANKPSRHGWWRGSNWPARRSGRRMDEQIEVTT